MTHAQKLPEAATFCTVTVFKAASPLIMVTGRNHSPKRHLDSNLGPSRDKSVELSLQASPWLCVLCENDFSSARRVFHLQEDLRCNTDLFYLSISSSLKRIQSYLFSRFRRHPYLRLSPAIQLFMSPLGRQGGIQSTLVVGRRCCCGGEIWPK